MSIPQLIFEQQFIFVRQHNKTYVMKKFLPLLSIFFFSIKLFAGNNAAGWSASEVSPKRFIENKSQFDRRDKLEGSKILFGIDQNGSQVYFTKNGLTFRFDEMENKERESGKERAIKYKTDIVHLQWENANPNAEIIAEEKTEDYFSYTNSQNENINYIKGYKKLVYKNLYPDIDVEYIFHEQGGIKYSLTLHPGADASQIKMKYTGADGMRLDTKGNLRLKTIFGDILDHAPQTFYESDKKSLIASAFAKNGNEISFSLGNYDKTKTIVIDPWTQTPTLPNSNGVWECERDAAGNVYIIGGCMPMKLLKYTAAGAIVWTYTTPWDTANNWLGTLATDNLGNSYVTSGSIAAMQKVNNAAGLVWSYNAPAASTDEYWTISFNCDQTKLIVGGTTGTAFPTNLQGCIFDINTSNGSINSKKIVGAMQGFSINECRSLTSSYNARYYYLTLDTMGCIDQNFSSCSAGGPIFAIGDGYNLAYKCENYRPNNGNAGIKSIRANKNFVYTQNGTTVQKRDLSTGAVLGSAAIPGGINTSSFGKNQIGNSGLDIDSCGNVYAGSANAVHKYDANLNLLSSSATSYVVSDVCVTNGGNIIACGTTGTSSSTSRTGYVQSISMSNCDPLKLICCDANICPDGPFCSSDPPQTLSASTPGGTWSGTGITNTSTGVFDPAVSGTGTFTITYTMACGTGTMQIVVNNCALPTVCIEANGDLTVSGGAGPAYQWQVQGTANDCSQCIFPAQCIPPAPNCPVIVTTWTTYSNNATATPPGTFPIRVLDANGNTVVFNSLTGIPPCSGVVNVNAVHTNVLCNGQCNGTANITASSGTQPYTYNWSGGQTTSAVTGLCAGTYTVLVSDAAAVTATSTVTITQPAALTSTATSTSASCGNGGSASVTPAGGTPSYTYSWSPSGGNSSSASGLAAGNYTASVTDANGCTTTSTVAITAASGGTVSVTAQTILCNGDSAGINANMTGGTSPFTYAWSSGQSTSSVNVPSGNYTITVTDAAGCTSSQSVNLAQPNAIASTVTVTNTICGASTGSASVAASGGTGTLTYNWNPGGQTTPSISNLGVGNYTCTITDANGCTDVQTANVVNANGPAANINSQTNITCNGATNGSANSSASGGTAPYTYNWSSGQTTQNVTGLSAGNYTITVTDASGCSNTQTVTITQPAAMTASVTAAPAACGQSDGTASVNPSGGTSPYTYLWTTFASTQSISGLVAGTYSVQVTDANGCSQTFAATVGNTGGPAASAASSATITSGSSTQLSASGGVTYSWSPANGLSCTNCSNPTASPAQTTQYCVFVTDANNCTDSACVLITVEAPCAHSWYLPNAFSPNGDGENEELKVYTANPLCVNEYRLAVFDRWGEKVFETQNILESWDGKRKGRTMDTQVAAYYLHIIFADGTEINQQGNVSLVR